MATQARLSLYLSNTKLLEITCRGSYFIFLPCLHYKTVEKLYCIRWHDKIDMTFEGYSRIYIVWGTILVMFKNYFTLRTRNLSLNLKERKQVLVWSWLNFSPCIDVVLIYFFIFWSFRNIGFWRQAVYLLINKVFSNICKFSLLLKDPIFQIIFTDCTLRTTSCCSFPCNGVKQKFRT